VISDQPFPHFSSFSAALNSCYSQGPSSFPLRTLPLLIALLAYLLHLTLTLVFSTCFVYFYFVALATSGSRYQVTGNDQVSKTAINLPIDCRRASPMTLCRGLSHKVELEREVLSLSILFLYFELEV